MIKKFHPDHLSRYLGPYYLPNVYHDMIQNHYNPNMDIVTLFDDEGEVIAFMGVNHLRIGVGEVWIIRSRENVQPNKIKFFKGVKTMLAFIQDKMELHRIELAIDCSWKGGDKWATSIGFKFEGIARAYDFNYRDHAIYTLIKERVS